MFKNPSFFAAKFSHCSTFPSHHKIHTTVNERQFSLVRPDPDTESGSAKTTHPNGTYKFHSSTFQWYHAQIHLHISHRIKYIKAK
jgi:hypothetical protein